MQHTVLTWFDRLSFPRQWRQEVEEAAHIYTGSPQTSMEHLLSALYRCDALAQAYTSKQIPDAILYDTLSDLLIWVNNHVLVHGTVGLLEPWWLEGHLNFQLFRLGRLQFKMGHSTLENEHYGLHKGDPVIEIHIPQGEPMPIEAVHASYGQAKDFFARYFPEHTYQYFICDSWLLDWHLQEFLKESSNILQFAREFDVIHTTPSDDAVRRLFELNPNKGPENSFQKKLRTFTENGGQLLEGFGILTWSGWNNDYRDT